MKSTLLTVALVAAGFSQASLADSSLIGTWQLVSMGCQSGAVPSTGSGGVTSTLTATAVISASQLDANIQIALKMDAASAATYEQQLQTNLAQVSAMPDGPEKQKELAQLNDALKNERIMAAGTQCQMHVLESYTMNGSLMHTQVISSKLDCPISGSSSNPQSEDSTIELSGNTLKMTSVTPEAASGGSCPAGDHEIITFTRIK
jgi:hypothetical protein